MPNNTGYDGYIKNWNDEIVIPEGYHNGNGINVVDGDEQLKFEGHADEYIVYGKTLMGASGGFSGDGTISAADVLSGEIAYSKGVKVVGSMPNNGASGGSIDGLTTLSVTIPAGYTTGGTVSLTGDIEEALAAI